jgi:hypothetical protein
MLLVCVLLVLASLVPAHAQTGTSTSQKRYHVGVVNGDTLWLDEYSREVGRLTEYTAQSGRVDPSDVMEQAWNDLLRRHLILQDASRRGITLSIAQVDSILLTAPPDFIKRGIVDEKGRFDRELLRAMLTSPDSLVRANTPGMTQQQRAEERTQLLASIAQLRERIGLMEIERRLRADVEAAFRFDTTGLYERYAMAATSALVDVLLTPCTKNLPQPSVSELKAYHAAHAADFTTPRPMRRLAFLAWPMTAAPVDSSLFLNNVRTFVSMLNGTTNRTRRDSIWMSVATTTSSGATRLSPDSASHATFYAAVRGRKVGAAVGPIVHPTGVHVLLVDTVHPARRGRAEISVRVIISEIEPSKQTVDSILTQVDEAAELYERGVEFGAIAGRFGRTIETSPWFTEDDRVFGSYRLADVAFATQRGAACDPIDTPERGTLLAVVLDSVPAGPLPFEAAIPRVADAILRQRGCDLALASAKQTHALASRIDDGTLFLVESPKGAQVARGLSAHADGMIGDVLFDPLATKEILAKPYPDLYGPFLGEAGWYTVNIITQVRPNDAEFPMWLELRKADIELEQRNALWDRHLTELRSRAEITDERWLYFRY